MYEYLLTIKVLFRLPWRATIGFAQKMLELTYPGKQIQVPDFGHASRESNKLNLKIKPMVQKEENMEIAFDSTGVNVYSTSGWHQRKYGKNALYRKREQWKKIHVAIDLNNMQVLSVAYTDSNTNDCVVVEELCDNIKGNIVSVRADGAYDTEAFRKLIYQRGAKDLIPPATTSKAQEELKHRPKKLKEHLKIRDAMIKEIRSQETFAQGLKQWKLNSGYHKRSRIEAFMCRFKKICGFYLQQKTNAGRLNEIITKMNILNSMTALGKAQYHS